MVTFNWQYVPHINIGQYIFLEEKLGLFQVCFKSMPCSIFLESFWRVSHCICTTENAQSCWGSITQILLSEGDDVYKVQFCSII